MYRLSVCEARELYMLLWDKPTTVLLRYVPGKRQARAAWRDERF